MPTGRDGWASRPTAAKLVVIAGYSKAIHVWDLRRIGRDLVAIGLRDELVASLPSEGPGRTLEIRAEAELSLAGAAEERARDRIARSRKRHDGEAGRRGRVQLAGLGLPDRSPAIA